MTQTFVHTQKRPRRNVVTQLSPEETEVLRNDIRLLEQFEQDVNTDFGKRLLKLLDDSIDDTVKKFISEQLETMEANKAIFFLASVRSKLQTLMALKGKYTNATKEKQELIAELNRVLGESQ